MSKAAREIIRHIRQKPDEWARKNIEGLRSYSCNGTVIAYASQVDRWFVVSPDVKMNCIERIIFQQACAALDLYHVDLAITALEQRVADFLKRHEFRIVWDNSDETLEGE